MPKVYVLGAGASKAVDNNAPLNNDLLKEILTEFPYVDRKIVDFICQFYDVSINDKSRLPFLEDVLSQIDFAISTNRPLSDEFSIEHIHTLRQLLLYGICGLLSQKINMNMTTGIMYEFLSKLSEGDKIISLNYDLILDNALHTYQAQNSLVNYVVPIRYLLGEGKRKEAYHCSSPIPVFKLHGSMNWVYCPFCQAVDASKTDYIFDIINKKKWSNCPVCGVRYQPLIITPTFLKDYHNWYLVNLWREAEIALAQAEEIVFIGYSMPPADIVLRCMFRRAFFANRIVLPEASNAANKDRCRVTIVDWDPKYNEENHNEIYDRYQRLFKRIVYYPQGFKAYVSNNLSPKN